MKCPEAINLTLDQLSEKYEIGVHDQQGGNSYVFRGKNRILGTEVVIKFYFWGAEERFHVEPQALANLTSPYILQVLDAGFADAEWAYFVSPFCSEGDLDHLLQCQFVSNLSAVGLTSDVLSGLSVLHAARLLHRDLKPRNIYLHNGSAIVGDLGSVCLLPDEAESVPASQHAVLYRAPESIGTNAYSTKGDIYQCGIVLYQLLGGYLPYEETAWLNTKQRQTYETLPYPESTVYVNQCLLERIRRGKILDMSSLPAWTSDKLKSIVRKATNLDPSKRFQSAAEFLAKLTQARASIRNWQKKDGCLSLEGSTCYRIVEQDGVYFAQKRRASVDWRNIKSAWPTDNLRELITEIEGQLRK